MNNKKFQKIAKRIEKRGKYTAIETKSTTRIYKEDLKILDRIMSKRIGIKFDEIMIEDIGTAVLTITFKYRNEPVWQELCQLPFFRMTIFDSITIKANGTIKAKISNV